MALSEASPKDLISPSGPTDRLYQQHFAKLGYTFCSNVDKNSAFHVHRFFLPFPLMWDHSPNRVKKKKKTKKKQRLVNS